MCGDDEVGGSYLGIFKFVIVYSVSYIKNWEVELGWN